MSTFSVHSLRSHCVTPWQDRVFSVEDLRAWRYPGSFLAVLGDPIAHSLSPLMHQAALAQLAQSHPKFRDWRYVKIQVKPTELSEALMLLHTRGFKGANLTLPLKEAVLDYLQTRSHRVKATGACNTLLRTATAFSADNTDVGGLQWALDRIFDNHWPSRPIIIWGAGGAARAAIYAAIERGAQDITVINRSESRLQKIRTDFKSFLQPGTQFKTYLKDALPEVCPTNALHIHATPQGLKSEAALPIPLQCLAPKVGVYDMVYSRQETLLVHTARSLGCLAADGRTMLARQGALALEHWTEAAVDTDCMLQALLT